MRTIIEFYCDKAGKWRWRAKRNGRIIADSGQGYTTVSGARNGVISLLGLTKDSFCIRTLRGGSQTALSCPRVFVFRFAD